MKACCMVCVCLVGWLGSTELGAAFLTNVDTNFKSIKGRYKYKETETLRELKINRNIKREAVEGVELGN